MANYLDQTGLSYFWQQLKTKLAAKANLASPTFTGTPEAPTAAAGTSTTQIATTAFVKTAIDGQEILDAASGKLVNVQNAKAGSQIKELTLLNSGGTELTGKSVAITNKNLFRIDLISSSMTNKGVTFTRGSDGGITASGTTTGTYASTTCSIDKNALVPGVVYALSCVNGGTVYAQLAITYTDNTTQYLAASTSYTVFMVPKAVQSVVGSVQITNSGVSVSATVYPQLEVSGVATDFVNNTYTTYTTGALPTLPATVSNVYSTDDTVATIEMTYVTDMTDALKNANAKSEAIAESKANTSDLAAVALSGSYSDLTGSPSIPSKTSDLTNDSGFITKSLGVWYGTCATEAATQAKVVTLAQSGFTLEVGACVVIKFTNAQTYNGQPTLNVAGTGAVGVVRNGTTAEPQYAWLAGETLLFIYDGTNWIDVDGALATTTYYGVTKLSSSTSSTSTSMAATPSAVKAAYDLANGKATITYSTTDLTPGTSALTTGEFYAVYE